MLAEVSQEQTRLTPPDGHISGKEQEHHYVSFQATSVSRIGYLLGGWVGG